VVTLPGALPAVPVVSLLTSRPSWARGAWAGAMYSLLNPSFVLKRQKRAARGRRGRPFRWSSRSVLACWSFSLLSFLVLVRRPRASPPRYRLVIWPRVCAGIEIGSTWAGKDLRKALFLHALRFPIQHWMNQRGSQQPARPPFALLGRPTRPPFARITTSLSGWCVHA